MTEPTGIINMNTQEEDNPILQFLSRPKPLHAGEPQKKLTAFPLLDNPLDESAPIKNELQEAVPMALNGRIVQLRERVHKLEGSLPELFSQPLYQSHPDLNLSSNERFCELSINLKTKNHSQLKKNGCQREDQLQFQSRFECGNLAMATQANELNSYLLCLQRDINTTGATTQWFFFRVGNRHVVGKVRFHIINLIKPYSSYTDGMLPVVGSDKGFQRGCTDIDYRRNTLPRDGKGINFYYTLSFTYQFKHPNEQIYFSHSFPYSYTKLQRYLSRLERFHPRSFHKRKIGVTALGNNIDCITITNPQINKIKPVVFITCRVHPGQTPSSYVLEGMLNDLLASGKEREHMRNELIFKIVPMLNPDGVIHGNYRTSLNGVDLNRLWREQTAHAYPQTSAIRTLIKECTGNKLAFFDLHGHSKKKGVFAYGCMNRTNPYQVKQLPYLLHRAVKDFNYHSCNFVVEQCRQGTARVAVWRQFGIAHSYTIETSFLGPERERVSYSIKDYHRIGGELIDAIYQYFCRKKFGVTTEATQIIEEFYKDAQLLKVGENPQQGSSDSDDDEPQLEMSAIMQPSPRKFSPPKTSNTLNRTGSPPRTNLRRTRLGLRKPKHLPAQLQTKVTQINLNRTNEQHQPIPLLISIGQRFGRTVEIRDGLWRYPPLETAISFKPCASKFGSMLPGAVVQESRQRNCYVNFRKFKTTSSVQRPPSGSPPKPKQNSRVTFSVEMGRTRIYI